MDIGRAFTYFTADPDYIKKLLLGGLFRFIPIVSFISEGYIIEQMKGVSQGRETPLPEWSDMGAYFRRGLMVFVGQLVYMIPLWLIMCCFWLGMMAMAPEGDSPLKALAGISTLLLSCAGCLLPIYGLVLAFFMPAFTVRFALTDQVNAFFQFGPAWQAIRANMNGYLMNVLGVILAGFVASIIGSVTCGLGYVFAFQWIGLVMAYLFGNWARSTPQIAS